MKKPTLFPLPPKEADYPPEWQSGEIQKRICDLANWRCEHCGMEFPVGDTRATTARRKDGKPFILTVHHINGIKSDVRWQNLVALCQACHLFVQYRWQPPQPLPRQWATPPHWILIRDLDFKESVTCQQKSLF